MIVTADHGVTLIGGGDVAPADLTLALTLAPLLVAADGGADFALVQGHMPQAVIGDFDSLSRRARVALPPAHLHQVAEQESTDFDKCLRNITAPFVLGLGFLGGRLDHELAAFSTLAHHPARVCILLGARDICFLAPAAITLGLEPGTRLSLYPLGDVQGESEGLRWPIAGIPFAPAGPIGTSNEVVHPEVRLRFDAPRMLIILPRDCLQAALHGLGHAPDVPGE